MDYEGKIQNSLNYIEDNLCEKMKLIEIAKQSYFSEYYFHKLFRNIVGTTVMDYIRKRRLTEAAKDLVKTNEQITEIAFKYQFSSGESFSRAFKRMYGMSPRKYRNTAETEYSHNRRMYSKYAKKSSRCGGTVLSLAA
ncbi:MAG: helix-turn-helix transcriptional regulator [Peptococcaceae bacterium]